MMSMHWTIIQITRKIQIYLKDWEEHVSAVLKVRMFQKVFFVNWQFWKKIDWYEWVYSLFVDDSYKNRCITMRCETAVSEMNAYVTRIDALDQLTSQEAE
jgi:hypothetical protein